MKIAEQPNIALLAASQIDCTSMSYSQFRLRCQREEHRLTTWTHGLLELSVQTPVSVLVWAG